MTTLCAPPTVWRMFVLHDLRGHSLKIRELASAGEPLNPEVIQKVRAAWGITIRDGYGQTETTAQIGNPPGETVRLGSMGRPLPGYRVALLGEDGAECDDGEIALPRGPESLGLMSEDGGGDIARREAHIVGPGRDDVRLGQSRDQHRIAVEHGTQFSRRGFGNVAFRAARQ